MSQPATITNVLVIPGVTAVQSGWSVLVGLVLDDQQIAWSECRFDSAETEPDFELDDGIRLLQEVIIPALVGQSLTDIGELMTQMDGMVREVEVVRSITAETGPPKLSRRELFSSLVNPDQEIREVVERPLPSELRLGVSLALVKAAAMADGRTVFEAVAELYGLERAASPLAVHLLFEKLPNPNDRLLSGIRAASYGLVVEEGESVTVLGNDGIRLQNRVRQLKNRVVGPAKSADGNGRPTPVSFLFDLRGGYGQLYEHNSGRILGAIEGLERTVEGCGLGLVDPFLMDDWLTQMAKMKQLQNYLRIRKMRTMLLAREGADTAETIQALADHQCCGGVVLDMGRLGTVQRTIELVQAAKGCGLAVVLEGVRGETAVQVAMALNPTLLAVGVGDVSAVMNEMNKTLAWIGERNG